MSLQFPEFEVKSVSELAKLSNEEVAAYKQAQQEYFQKNFELMQEHSKKQSEKVAELEEKAKKDHEIILKQGEDITKFKKGGKNGGTEKKALKVVLKEGVEGLGIDKIKAGTGGITLDATKVSVADTAEYFGQRLLGVSKEPVRTPMIFELFRTINVPNGSGAKIKYIEQDVVTRGADNVSFCSPFPESDITFDTVEEKIKKIADSIVVCNDDLEDFDFLEREVVQLMQENIPLKLDEQILLGDPVDPLQFNSINSVAQGWSVGVGSPISSWAAAVQDANIFDLMRSAVYQIRLSMQTDNRFNPDTILMNPADFGLLKSTKDNEGQPFIPYFMIGGEVVIEGATVKESIIVPANTMYVFDSTKGDIYVSRDMRIDFATQHAEHFLEDKVAWRASMKGQFIVRNQYKNSFLKVNDIAASILAITKP
jgi:HK97 family phage major capsid protein